MDKTGKYLFDIDHAISLIESFMVDIPDYKSFAEDIKTQSAVERQLAIIGEAVGKLMQENPNIQFSNARQIVNFRNRIIHSYDNIDVSIVWIITQRYIPLLKQEVKSAM